jgi:hypothetical protein
MVLPDRRQFSAQGSRERHNKSREVLMQQRIDATKVSPAAYKAVAALQAYVDQSGLDAKLREFIKIRASQING